MVVGSSISTFAKNVVHLNCNVHTQMGSNICSVLSRKLSSSCCLSPGHSSSKSGFSVSKTLSFPTNTSQKFQGSCFSYSFTKQRSHFHTLTVKDFTSTGGLRRRQREISFTYRSMNMKLLVPKNGIFPKKGPVSWPQGCASAGLIFGLLICCSSSEPVHAEAASSKDNNEENSNLSHVKFSHGKEVYTDYSVIGIPGDGRCLFRSVAHGACLQTGKPAPSESLQRELADNLRARVADEFIKRRKETEWFVEGDFDTYISQMRKPHVWGGEPELLMASHVLQMPIYMYDKDAGGLISIAEYGQEYGKENPIRVLYHGFGHYDALHIPGMKGPRSRI